MRARITFLTLAMAVVCASAQTTPPTPQPSQQDPDSKLTPEQLREKQIRMFDPLDKSNPLVDDSKAGDSQDKNAAQDPRTAGDAATQGQRPVYRPASEAPLPGSIAASRITEQQSRGPRVVSADDESGAQDYSGPAVLSRSYTISRPTSPQNLKWAPTLGFSSSYDITPTGAGTSSGVGYVGSWGVSGRHLWRRDQIGLTYNGSVSRIGGYNAGAGTSQNLSADYQHRFSRRLSLDVVTTGAVLSQNYGLQTTAFQPGVSIANLNLAASPELQVLDTGTRQLANQVSLTYRQSARLSFSAAGGLFFVQRTSGLFGNTGYQAQGDVNYRKTRKLTVGVYYAFADYMFSHRIGLSNQNTFGGIYSYSLDRSTQIRLRAGITMLESEGLQTVTIDPAIAALLGQTTTIVNSYTRRKTSDISAQFVKDFRNKKTASVSYVRGVSPGNGLLLTSIQEGISASFAMRMFRRYEVSFGGDRTYLTSALQTTGKYGSESFNFTCSRPVSHHMNANFGVSYRMFDVTGSPLLSYQFRVISGISWSPGENWLKSW